MKDSKTHWFGLKFSIILFGLKQWKRPNFACKRKRAAAKSRGLAQKIEHCSIGANWCDLMRTVLRSTARHGAAWCEVVRRVYCKHASDWLCTTGYMPPTNSNQGTRSVASPSLQAERPSRRRRSRCSGSTHSATSTMTRIDLFSNFQLAIVFELHSTSAFMTFLFLCFTCSVGESFEASLSHRHQGSLTHTHTHSLSLFPSLCISLSLSPWIFLRGSLSLSLYLSISLGFSLSFPLIHCHDREGAVAW